MNLAFLPLFTPFMSAGPGILVGPFKCVHFGRRWKESGEHGILNHLMRGDRQRFCPACSGAASSQRPLTGSDTSLCCRPKCVWVCARARMYVCVGASPASLHPALASASGTIFAPHLSIYSHFLTGSACLFGLGIFCVCVFGQRDAYLRVRWGFLGGEAERSRVMRQAAVMRTGSLPAGVWPWPTVSVCWRSPSMKGKPRERNK